jgi:hypothetical protein
MGTGTTRPVNIRFLYLPSVEYTSGSVEGTKFKPPFYKYCLLPTMIYGSHQITIVILALDNDL